jgi:hypothetical protein
VVFNPGRDKSFSSTSSPARGPTQSVQEVLGFFPGVKWPGCEVDHCALPSSAGFENKWTYAFASPYAFMAWIRTTILFFYQFKN